MPEKRLEYIGIRFRTREARALRAAAKQRGETISEYIRRILAQNAELTSENVPPPDRLGRRE